MDNVQVLAVRGGIDHCAEHSAGVAVLDGKWHDSVASAEILCFLPATAIVSVVPAPA